MNGNKRMWVVVALIAWISNAQGADAPPQRVAEPGVPAAAPATAALARDVELFQLYGMVHVGHVSTPFGITGMACSTTSCNRGTTKIQWFAPMEEDHPGILQNMYREMNGRFEQVGASWVKHGFFALESSQCNTCQGGSQGGRYLGLGCSDTYSSGNNSSRTYLGPRWEWEPFAGTWECTGSHFADGLPDCVRRHDGADPHTDSEHMLEVRDDALALPGALYYYEGVYVVRGDEDKSNNIGSKSVTMTWIPPFWIFTSSGSTTPPGYGAAVDRWGDVQTDASSSPTNGYVHLNAQVTDLGGGTWHYEYVLYNADVTGDIGLFSLPVGDAEISNVGFHDVDPYEVLAEWAPVLADGVQTWSTADNPMRMYTAYNFWFDSDHPPVEGEATIGIFGTGVEFSAATTLPGVAGPPLVAAASMADHGPAGALPVAIDLAASVDVESGDVATESRLAGITVLKLQFGGELDAGAGGLNEAAATITSNPPGVTIPGFTTSLEDANQTLVLTFDGPLWNGYVYTLTLSTDVTNGPADRDFEVRALVGNVCSQAGSPQQVNALDLGLGCGLRGNFLPVGELVDATNAGYDVNLDGTVNAVDYACVRLVCGAFGTTAP